MKAYELQAKEGQGVLALVTRESRELGPNDVRVGVRATALNFRDLVMLRSAHKRKAPGIPVSDGAGEVLEVGGKVTRFKRGDRVAASFFPTWRDGEFAEHYHPTSLGSGQDGMLAEEVVLHEDAWVRVPDALSFEEAATLPCAGVTAYNALFCATSLRVGDTVLVQGTGGVSIFGLQLAKAAGARVVLTSSSAAKMEQARTLGADFTIDYKTDAKWGDSARVWTGGRGVDVAIDVGGPGTFDQSVAALRYGGTMALLGVLTGTKGEVNTYGVFHKALRIAGIYVGSVQMFEGLVRAVEASKIRPVIDRVFAFDEAKAAYDHLASASHFGKVVIKVG